MPVAAEILSLEVHPKVSDRKERPEGTTYISKVENVLRRTRPGSDIKYQARALTLKTRSTSSSMITYLSAYHSPTISQPRIHASSSRTTTIHSINTTLSR